MFVANRTSQWRHNDHDGVSNHQPHGCLLNRLFRRRSKKTSKLRVTGLCVGNSPGPVNSPHKGPVTRKMFPFDDVIMRIIPLFFSDISFTENVLQIEWFTLFQKYPTLYPLNWTYKHVIDTMAYFLLFIYKACCGIFMMTSASFLIFFFPPPSTIVVPRRLTHWPLGDVAVIIKM